MSMEFNPEVARALSIAARFQSALDGQLNQMNNKSFRAHDETKTVEVTVNGHQWLTGIRIENGLLDELGAETVEARVNEALRNAQNAATVHNAVADQVLTTALTAMSQASDSGLA